jgi:hypothetical protein
MLQVNRTGCSRADIRSLPMCHIQASFHHSRGTRVLHTCNTHSCIQTSDAHQMACGMRVNATAMQDAATVTAHVACSGAHMACDALYAHAHTSGCLVRRQAQPQTSHIQVVICDLTHLHGLERRLHNVLPSTCAHHHLQAWASSHPAPLEGLLIGGVDGTLGGIKADGRHICGRR